MRMTSWLIVASGIGLALPARAQTGTPAEEPVAAETAAIAETPVAAETAAIAETPVAAETAAIAETPVAAETAEGTATPDEAFAPPEEGTDIEVQGATVEEFEEAQSTYFAGEQLFAEGRYAEAIAAFQRSYDLVPFPDTMFNIAAGYEALGALPEAKARYQAIADAADASEDLRAQGRDALARVELALAPAPVVPVEPTTPVGPVEPTTPVGPVAVTAPGQGVVRLSNTQARVLWTPPANPTGGPYAGIYVPPPPPDQPPAEEAYKPRILALGFTLLTEHGLAAWFRARYKFFAFDFTVGWHPWFLAADDAGEYGYDNAYRFESGAHLDGSILFFFEDWQKGFNEGIKLMGIWDQVAGPGAGIGWTLNSQGDSFVFGFTIGLQYYPLFEDSLLDFLAGEDCGAYDDTERPGPSNWGECNFAKATMADNGAYNDNILSGPVTIFLGMDFGWYLL